MSPTVNRLQRASNHEIKTAKNRLSRVNVLRAWSDNDIGLAKVCNGENDRNASEK